MFAFRVQWSAPPRDVIKDKIGGKLPSGRPFRPDVRGRVFTVRGRVFTVRGRGKNHWAPSARTLGCVRAKKNKKIKK
jgi:hypothetical protein